MTTHLTCRDVSEFLLEYVGDTLEPDVLVTFETHVHVCPNCGVFVQQYRDTIAAGRLACADRDVTECPEDLVQAVLDALLDESKDLTSQRPDVPKT